MGVAFVFENPIIIFTLQHVAALNSPVLLQGETGVGKDIIAGAIHFLSLRFKRAHTGTILLDEIGELQAQVRLLRVLQDKKIERVGGNKSISLDIRIIAATNRNLKEMVESGQFREDLWFRINVLPVRIPPLRQRKSDIPAMVDYFILQKSRELKLPDIPYVAPGQVELLTNYNWPGNVRELQNLIERALILNPLGPLTFKSLDIQKQQSAFLNAQPCKTVEKLSRHIRFALSQSKGKIHGKDGAAELLGVNPNTLRSRMKKLGIHHDHKNKK